MLECIAMEGTWGEMHTSDIHFDHKTIDIASKRQALQSEDREDTDVNASKINITKNFQEATSVPRKPLK